MKGKRQLGRFQRADGRCESVAKQLWIAHPGVAVLKEYQGRTQRQRYRPRSCWRLFEGAGQPAPNKGGTAEKFRPLRFDAGGFLFWKNLAAGRSRLKQTFAFTIENDSDKERLQCTKVFANISHFNR